MSATLRVPVAIVGAGPAGLLLAHLLGRAGIASLVLELRSREHVLGRIRAGLLEAGNAERLRAAGLGERLDRDGVVQDGFELRVDGASTRLSTLDLVGASMHLYSQQRVVRDLLDARAAAGDEPHFDVPDVRLVDLGGDGEPATLECTLDGEPVRVVADVVAGCDGFHGLTRASVPAGARTEYRREFPYGWLGVLAETPPVGDELVYNVHERGFTLHSMRSPQVSRQYLQVSADTDIATWPDERIWAELRTRLAGDPRLVEGRILEKGITAMRAFVVEPMRHRRLFLVGDAAHIVPPTAAKGLSLALEDAGALAGALVAWFSDGDRAPLDGYSASRVESVWRAQEFSAAMTDLLHVGADESPFDRRLRLARLHHLVTSRCSARAFAEDYTGLSRAPVVDLLAAGRATMGATGR